MGISKSGQVWADGLLLQGGALSLGFLSVLRDEIGEGLIQRSCGGRLRDLPSQQVGGVNLRVTGSHD